MDSDSDCDPEMDAEISDDEEWLPEDEDSDFDDDEGTSRPTQLTSPALTPLDLNASQQQFATAVVYSCALFWFSYAFSGPFNVFLACGNGFDE